MYQVTLFNLVETWTNCCISARLPRCIKVSGVADKNYLPSQKHAGLPSYMAPDTVHYIIPVFTGRVKWKLFWMAFRKFRRFFIDTHNGRPCTLLCPRTGQVPAPGFGCCPSSATGWRSPDGVHCIFLLVSPIAQQAMIFFVFQQTGGLPEIIRSRSTYRPEPLGFAV